MTTILHVLHTELGSAKRFHQQQRERRENCQLVAVTVFAPR